MLWGGINMLVIRTQYLENYGTPTDPYWKMKGGSEYKVLGVPANVDLDEVVSCANVEQDNDYIQEYVVGYSIESEDYLSWFEKSQLEYDGEIMCPEPTIEYKEICYG